VSFESLQTTYSQIAQPAYPIKGLSTIDFTMKESQKDKMVREDGLDKLVAPEQRTRAFEGISLHDHIKVVKICLVPNVIIPKILECLNSSNQCPVTHLNVYCNKIVEVVYNDKLLLHFFQDNLSDAALTWYMRLGNTKVKK